MRMKLGLFVLMITISLVISKHDVEMKPIFKKFWNHFKNAHNKVYATVEEEVHRFNIWKKHFKMIRKHNKEATNGTHTYWLKMNNFGDLTNEEFSSIYNGYMPSLRGETTKMKSKTFEYDPSIKTPDSVDWREKGYVTEVKNQGQCGSCWAFSTTGSLEGQHFKATGQLVSLSEQNLVDCSGKYGNLGCNGGLMDQAFQYVKENGGIDTEETYPYHGRNEKCSYNSSNVGATDKGFVDVQSKDEDALKQALATIGPISVAIDAGHVSFQFYHHGKYDFVVVVWS
jgi:cathepsin L